MEKSGKAFMHRVSTMQRDIYETPYSITEQLLYNFKFFKTDSILEPACGNNAIVKVLKKYGYSNLKYYDLYGEMEHKKDFLQENNKFDWIITNPPYNIADEFVEKGLKVANKGLMYFMRLNYLSGQKRYKKDIYNFLSDVFVFTRMPDLRAKIRGDGKYPTAGIVYAWFIWSKQNSIHDPIIKWIDNRNYVLKKADI